MGLFDLEVIKKGFFKPNNYAKGLRILDKGNIDVNDIKIDKFTDEKLITALVSDEEDTENITTLSIKPSTDHSTLGADRRCSCEEYTKNKENCEHMAALVNFLQSYEYDQITMDNLNSNESDKRLLSTIDIYKDYLTNKVDNKMFYLIPSVIIGEDGLKVEFKITKKFSQSYRIENLEKFVNLITENKTFKDIEFVGEINHTNLEPKSMMLISLIKENLDKVKDERFLKLGPQNFFDLFGDYPHLNFSFNNNNLKEVEFVKKPIPFEIVIKEYDGIVKLKLQHPEFEVVKVDDYLFWLNGNDINYYHFTSKYFNVVFDRLFQKEASLKLEDYLKFKVFVLSYIEDEIKVEETLKGEDLTTNLSPIKCELDYDGKQIIIQIGELNYLLSQDFSQNIDYVRLIKLYNLISSIITEEGNELRISNERAMYEFISKDLPIIKSWGIEVSSTSNFNKLEVIDVKQISLDVKEEGVDISFSIEIEGLDEKEIQELIKKLGSKEKIIKINNKIVNLDSDVFKSLLDLYELLGFNQTQISPRVKLSKNKMFLLESLKGTYTNLDFRFSSQIISHLEQIKELNVSDFNPGKLISCDLRDYQEEGINYILSLMKLNYGAILADEMGLGKTIQALSIASYFINNKQDVLVTAPTSLLYNWKNEIDRLVPGAKVLLVEGDKQNREKLYKNIKDYDIVLISYNLLKRDIEEFEKEHFDLFILDEAQYIKNFDTQNSNAINKVNSSYRLAITGTPIENGVKDLYSIINFIIPDFFGSYRNFHRFFELPIISENDQSRLKILKKIVSPFIVRRLKQDVLASLPQKKEQIIYNQMNPQQYELYREYITKFQKQIQDNPALTKVELLSMLIRLRQIAIDPRLIDGCDIKGEKIKSLIDQVNICTEKGEKVLIFSQFVKMLDIIEDELDAQGISYYILTGTTPKELRQEMVNQFNNGNDVQVFLISLKAGGTGLNLTSANNVIITDPWWNKSVENQAADRVHRIGQKRDVVVKRLITDDSIEEKIMDIQDGKISLSENLLTDEITGIELLDIEELKELIR